VSDTPVDMTDQSAWAEYMKNKYRQYPLPAKIFLLLFMLPFVFIKWGGEHGEALIEVMFDPRVKP
jgi:hypothetical protein